MNISYLSLKKKERKKENPNICCFSTPICWVLFCCCCFLQYTNLIYPGDCIGFVLICVWLYNPMDCSLPGSSVHGIFQARILEWVVISFSRDLPNPGMKPVYPAIPASQADCLPLSRWENPISADTMVKNLSASARDAGLIPGSGKSLGEGNGNPLQHFRLENPMNRGRWWTTIHGVPKSWTWPRDWVFTCTAGARAHQLLGASQVSRGFPEGTRGKEPACQCRRLKRCGFESWVRKICWRRDRLLLTPVFLGFPCGSAGKESTCNVGDLGLIPGLGISPGEEEGNPTQYSCLGNPMDRATGRLQSVGSQRVRHDWTTSLSLFYNNS